MNIVYLHQYFNSLSDPGSSRSYEFARRLVALGHTVHMVTSGRADTGQAQGWQESLVDGIHIHAISVPYGNKMSYRQRLSAFFRFAFHASGRAAKLRPDIVFATSTPLTIALPAIYASRRRHVPMVFEVRDLWPEMPIAVGAIRHPLLIGAAKWLERTAYRNATRVVALSPGMEEGVVSTGYPDERVSTIPNACDLDLFDVGPATGLSFRERFPWLRDRPLVVYVGTLGYVNGVSYLVQVASECRTLHPDVRFLIVGDGKEKPDVERLAREKGVLGVNLHFMDPVPKTDVPMILSAADVATSLFIDLPPMWKNSANKFFDALASGTPVAINYHGWQADLLDESGAGIVLPAGDPAGAARSIVDLLMDRERLSAAANAARDLAVARFSRDLLADRFEQVLLSAV